MNSDLIINELTKLLTKLRTAEQEALWRFSEAQEQLHKIREQLRAVETTMNLSRQATTPDTGHASLVTALREAKAKGKTQLEALEIIATRNNGHLKVVDAQRLMVETGLIGRPKNALSILYTLISRSGGKFSKIKPGEYQLLREPKTANEPEDASSSSSITGNKG